MRNIHTYFTEFDPGVLEATRRFFDSDPWKGTEEERFAKFDRWLIDTSYALSIVKPDLEFAPPDECAVYGGYVFQTKTIVLPKFSATTMFYAFRIHYLLVSEEMPTTPYEGHAWATSLYHTVDPEGFREAVESGRILSVQPEDLEEAV